MEQGRAATCSTAAPPRVEQVGQGGHTSAIAAVGGAVCGPLVWRWRLFALATGFLFSDRLS